MIRPRGVKRNGVLVVNLLSRDRAVHDYIHRIEDSFAGRVATVMARAAFGNLIVFAFKHSPRQDPLGKFAGACKAARNKNLLCLLPGRQQVTAAQAFLSHAHAAEPGGTSLDGTAHKLNRCEHLPVMVKFRVGATGKKVKRGETDHETVRI